MLFFKKKFQEPWNLPFSQRLKTAVEKSNKKCVFYIYEKPDSSSFRYRVYNMCQALERSLRWHGVYFFENEISLLLPYLEHASLIIFCRAKWSFAYDHFIAQAKRFSIPLLFDIDDLVFNPDETPLVMNTLNIPSKDYHLSQWFGYATRLLQLGKKCDGTIGTNAYLSLRMQEIFQKPAFSLCNFLNNEQIATSAPLFEAKRSKEKGPSFTLGYFSGSATHINDFAKIAPAVKALLEEFPSMHLTVAGYMQFPHYLVPLVKAKRISHLPFVDYLTLQKNISNVDINLVPLVDNCFTQCKSELKFFEAAIVGSVTCATPTFVFKENIDPGKTGYLCEEGDWYPLIKKIYQNKSDQELIERANTYCLNKYSPAAQLPLIETVLDKAIGLFQ